MSENVKCLQALSIVFLQLKCSLQGWGSWAGLLWWAKVTRFGDFVLNQWQCSKYWLSDIWINTWMTRWFINCWLTNEQKGVFIVQRVTQLIDQWKENYWLQRVKRGSNEGLLRGNIINQCKPWHFDIYCLRQN